VKAEVTTRLARLQRLGLVARAAVLVSAVALTYAVAAAVAWNLSGTAGLQASAVAAGVCLFGAALALVVSHRFRDPESVLYGVLFGMLLRMGIPLAFAVYIFLEGGGLAEAGVLYYFVAFYPVTLGVETVLSLPPTACPARRPNSSQDVS